MVTYTDGTSTDAGQLPTGPACPTGFTLQTVQVVTSDGPVQGAICVADMPPTSSMPDPAPS
jgi:hypothetical protein